MPTITSTSFPSTNVATNFTQLGVTYSGGGTVSISSFNGARSAPYYSSMQSSGGHPTFSINAGSGGAVWAFWVKGVSGNANVTVKIDGSATLVTGSGGTQYANGTFPFYSFSWLPFSFVIPAGSHTVTFEATGIWAMDDAELTIQDPPYAAIYTSTGSLILRGDSAKSLSGIYTSTGSLILRGDSAESLSGIIKWNLYNHS